MQESSVSEHGFNLKDAEHIRGSNRYWFKYPETWYNSQNFANLTVGLRSIILKPDALDVNLTAFQIAKISDGKTLAPFLHFNYSKDNVVESAYLRPNINGFRAYPDRLPLKTNIEINEGIKMGDICDMITESCDNGIQKYNEMYSYAKQVYDSKYQDDYYKFLEKHQITGGNVDFTYNKDRQFVMTTTNPNRYKFMLTFRYFFEDPQLAPLSPTEPTQTTEDSYQIMNGFWDDFEMLLSLRFEGDLSLNKLLTGLAGINKDYTIETAQKDCLRYGIKFDGVQLINYAVEAEYEYDSTNKKYDINKPKTRNQFAQAVLFKSLTVNQVWSRKDLLIKSSIAELDVNNYLGYSTMTTSSPVCIYASPKMYPIESQSFKFWVELYDSYNDDVVELPDKVVLIIEAALYLNPKLPFNRY